MAIITLTTDLGLKDYYVSSVKGAILSQLPEATIIDISHEIQPFNEMEASFVLKNSYPHFPQGSIHIMGVKAQPDSNSPYIAIFVNGHYFIGSDNGIFSLMFDKIPDKIVELNIKQDSDYLAFPVKDIFVKAACHIARGGTLEIIGNTRDRILERISHKPNSDKSSIRGMVIYIDRYGNAITNITKQLFRDIGMGRQFVLSFARSYTIDAISKSYNDVPESEILALFGLSGFLEIAQNKGMANKILGLKLHDTITINFDDN